MKPRISHEDRLGMSRRTRLSSSLFFGALGMFTAGLSALAAYESYALATGTEPITEYTKNEIRQRPVWAMALLFALGILTGHFWTSAPARVLR